MPVDYNDQTTWDKVYGTTGAKKEPWKSDYEWRQPDGSYGDYATRQTNPETRRSKRIVGYNKAYASNYGTGDEDYNWYAQVRDTILAAFPGMQTTDRYFFCGCGFGYLMKKFRDLGYTNSWGIEPSTFIQNNAVTESDNGIILVDEAIASGNALLNKLNQITGEKTADWVIDEEILLGYTDAEITQIVANPSTRFVDLFERILTGVDQTQIIHLVRVGDNNPNYPEVIRRPDLATWQAFDSVHSWISLGS